MIDCGGCIDVVGFISSAEAQQKAELEPKPECLFLFVSETELKRTTR